MTAANPDVTGPPGSSRLLRQLNDRAALGCLFLRGRLTRPELVELTGLSKPTASEVIKRLQAAELVTVVGRTSGGPGPRADVYALNPGACYGAAVSIREPDLLDLAILDLTGQTRHEVVVATNYPDRGLPELIAGHIRDAFDATGLAAQKLRRVQLAVPGSYDARNDVVRNVDIPGCEHPGLGARLNLLLNADIGIDNDVNLATLAERHHGRGGMAGFALLWLGERGIGLGIDLAGGLLHGFSGAAGELGYLPATTPSGDATLQDLAGGPALLELAAEHGIAAHTASIAMRTAVAADDLRFLDAVAGRLAGGLAAVAAVVDPAIIVLSGEVGAAGGDHLARALGDRLAKTAFSCPVVSSTVTGNAVLLGAQDAVAAGMRDALLTSPAPLGDRPRSEPHRPPERCDVSPQP